MTAIDRSTSVSDSKTEQAYLPDIVIDSLHHTGFRLSDSRLKAFCLAVTGHSRRSMAYCTVGVHLCHSLGGKMRLIKTVSGMIHNLVEYLGRSKEQVGYDVERELVRWYKNRGIIEVDAILGREPRHRAKDTTAACKYIEYKNEITNVSNDARYLRPTSNEPFGGVMRREVDEKLASRGQRLR